MMAGADAGVVRDIEMETGVVRDVGCSTLLSIDVENKGLAQVNYKYQPPRSRSPSPDFFSPPSSPIHIRSQDFNLADIHRLPIRKITLTTRDFNNLLHSDVTPSVSGDESAEPSTHDNSGGGSGGRVNNIYNSASNLFNYLTQSRFINRTKPTLV
jgi:hypothetical protein